MQPVALRLRGALTEHPWVAPSALAMLSVIVLVARLGSPDRIMFDEVYYVEDARGYLDIGVEPGFAVHPMVGKWFIAAGIALFGDRPVGWRMVPALAGVATVVLTYLLARRLLRGAPDGWWLALLAPLLLLADGLFVTQSRIAMLDIFLVLFSVAGLWVLVVDRDQRLAGRVRPWRPSLRVVAGVLFGLAIGVKWSGLLLLGAAGLLTIGWELGAARRTSWRSLPRRAAAVVGSLVLVPAIVYVATWTPWIARFENTHTAGCRDADTVPCEYSLAERWDGLLRHHDAMLGFHLGLEASHTYRSDPLGWVVLQRPVVYHWSTCSAEDASAAPTFDERTLDLRPVCDVDQGSAAEVLAVGNPALWWGWLLLLPLLVAGTVRRDGRSAVPLVWWLSAWLPWLPVSRTAFLFYLAPAVPLLAVGTVVALHRLGAPAPVRRTYLGAAIGAALAGGVVALPTVLGVLDGWRWTWLGAGLGLLLGSAIGGVADGAHERPPHLTQDGGTADQRSTSGRWALVAAVAVFGVAAWLAPVWVAFPLDEAAIRTRWLFRSWI